MHQDAMRMADPFEVAMTLGKNVEDLVGLVGYGTVALLDKNGSVKDIEPFMNKITTVGDLYYATRGAAGIGTPNIAQPTLITGMKLGTGVTAVAKSGAGSTLGTYITGSNKLFDTTHPTVTAVGTDVGYNITYKCTWAAGVVTNAAITEAALDTAAGTDSNAASASQIARITFGAKNKTVDDSLVITWAHTFFG